MPSAAAYDRIRAGLVLCLKLITRASTKPTSAPTIARPVSSKIQATAPVATTTPSVMAVFITTSSSVMKRAGGA